MTAHPISGITAENFGAFASIDVSFGRSLNIIIKRAYGFFFCVDCSNRRQSLLGVRTMDSRYACVPAHS